MNQYRVGKLLFHPALISAGLVIVMIGGTQRIRVRELACQLSRLVNQDRQVLRANGKFAPLIGKGQQRHLIAGLLAYQATRHVLG